MEKKGLFVIISGASGAGKTSIIEGAIGQAGFGVRVVTCTTRAPEVSDGHQEVDGVDYHFLSEVVFKTKIAAGEFAEHAEVYGRNYGTLKQDIEEARTTSPVIYAIVDVQGAATLMELYPEARSIFIDVPREELKERLILRNKSGDALSKRMATYDDEVQEISLFDKVIVNRNGRLSGAIAATLRYIAEQTSLNEQAVR